MSIAISGKFHRAQPKKKLTKNEKEPPVKVPIPTAKYKRVKKVFIGETRDSVIYIFKSKEDVEKKEKEKEGFIKRVARKLKKFIIGAGVEIDDKELELLLEEFLEEDSNDG